MIEICHWTVSAVYGTTAISKRGRHGDSKFSNRPVTFESNRDVRFELESNLEALQVTTVYQHKWSPVSCRSSTGQRKLVSQRPAFCHWATELTLVIQTVSRLLTLSDWLTFWSLSDDVSNQQLNVDFLHHDYLRTVFVLSTLYIMCCTHI